jgi:hypothetical protein
MVNIYLIPVTLFGIVFVSRLQLDVDPNAERVAVYDSATFELIATANCDDNKIFTMFFDESYAISDKLNIVIIDTDLQYNGAILTGVSCEIVDANIVL